MVPAFRWACAEICSLLSIRPRARKELGSGFGSAGVSSKSTKAQFISAAASGQEEAARHSPCSYPSNRSSGCSISDPPHRRREESLLPAHQDLPLLFPAMFEGHLHVALPFKPCELFSPFQQHQTIFFGEEFVQAKRIKLARRIDAIQIDVVKVDFWATEFMDQCKGGTGYVISGSGLQTFGDAFRQRGLAGAQWAAQNYHMRALQRRRQLPAQRHGFFGRMGDVLVRSHRCSVVILSA